MCGRYLLAAPLEALATQFQAVMDAPFPPRYNLAPTSSVPVVKAVPGGRSITLHHWGLIPSWAKDPALGGRMANARGETVADKPSFRSPFRHRRCLIPATGFYEWQARAEGGKQPFLIRPVPGELLAFAGLWDRWEGPGGPLESCTIITTAANTFMAPVHDRMPVLLAPDDYALWLDPACQDLARLQALLRPCPDGYLRMTAVGPRVGNVRNEGPDLMEPLP
jgi:putative SOS response-associated peptidase YedK